MPRMRGGVRALISMVSVAVLGCGAARPLDSAGTAGSAAGAAGASGTSGAAGAVGSSGAPPAGGSSMPAVAPTPKPASCMCAPGAGIDLLMCGGDWLPNTLRNAPEAVITPDGATVVFNRCNAEGSSCQSGVFRWKSGEGVKAVAPDAWAFAVSADGTSILATRTDASSFIVSSGGMVTELPLGNAYAHLLSADGGTVAARVEVSPSLTTAALWNVATGAQIQLGDLAGGPEYSEPTAINADASVVVGYGNTEKGQEPFLWTRGGGLVGVGTLPSQTVQTVALATSADGGVVVGSNLTDNGTAIFRWTASGGIAALGYIFVNLPLGAPESFFMPWTPPLLVSADGAVVAGTAAEPATPMLPQAFRWTASGGLQKLSTAHASIVRAASADGRVIAGSALASGAPPGMPFASLPYQPFVSVDGQGTRALADVLAGIDLDGMTFGDPIALSPDGRFLVGHATCAGAPAIFRAALPQ
jgi:hypothetical protein